MIQLIIIALSLTVGNGPASSTNGLMTVQHTDAGDYAVTYTSGPHSTHARTRNPASFTRSECTPLTEVKRGL
jgi:hypothetical protein